MKHIILVCIIGMFGCEKKWNESDQAEFLADCVYMNGTTEDCGCMLDCIQSEYENYQIALHNILKTENNVKVVNCLKKCKK